MITVAIGILAGCLLACCGVPQAVKTIKDGHAKGLSLNFMLMLIGGIFLMGLYIYLEHGWDWVIHGEYAISISVWAISLWYYFLPRKTTQDVALEVLNELGSKTPEELKQIIDEAVDESFGPVS